MSGRSIAIVHEWLTNLAGSEKVVAALRRTFPGAAVWTSMRWGPPFDSWRPVETSFLQRWANGPSAHVRVLPAMPLAFRSLRLPDDLDLVVTSFHSFALYCRIPAGTRQLVYCHTPPRFLWAAEQLAGERRAWIPALLGPARAGLRPIDRRLAGRPELMVANSQTVARRILAAYGRSAPVIHPPVDVERFAPLVSTPTDDYFLVVSRLVPYKQVGLAVEAFDRLGWPLVVVGGGRQAAELQAHAGPSIRFLGRVDDNRLPALMAGARALIMPGEEDFGITPVEAMACGVPVVALGRGGATETVRPGWSGVLFDEPTVESLVRAVRTQASTSWDRAAISASVSDFGEARFRAEMADAARSVLA